MWPSLDDRLTWVEVLFHVCVYIWELGDMRGFLGMDVLAASHDSIVKCSSVLNPCFAYHAVRYGTTRTSVPFLESPWVNSSGSTIIEAAIPSVRGQPQTLL